VFELDNPTWKVIAIVILVFLFKYTRKVLEITNVPYALLIKAFPSLKKHEQNGTLSFENTVEERTTLYRIFFAVLIVIAIFLLLRAWFWHAGI
jgi:hypothetical protein